MIRSSQTGLREKKLNSKPFLTAHNVSVRSVVEQGGVVCAGAAKTQVEQGDRAQHTFLMWLNFRPLRTFNSLNHPSLRRQFRIDSLTARIVQYDLSLIKSIFLTELAPKSHSVVSVIMLLSGPPETCVFLLSAAAALMRLTPGFYVGYRESQTYFWWRQAMTL